ncbi:hypothetical protein PPL_10431 [Heterostelium album PN500]|uniref:Uncharacterized protein n=1 Tax=Heterostelium pallidum (strain ATCC 26659 / Pp 5 / PN500) TaxID=670386 RepID=D3BR27_HETP5|nr:hypothetical protein PPL_10431 [Heterostelium album PN500]EFA75859.1 hypothetical protein PPL_10431 [Heterostelium album PN500]|eukprot:XP_020427993.1 hypothetical protein PPL_10431 [Heterostelium album PN500]
MFTIDLLSNAKPKKQKRLKESTIVEIRSFRDELSNKLLSSSSSSSLDNQNYFIFKKDHLLPITLSLNYLLTIDRNDYNKNNNNDDSLELIIQLLNNLVKTNDESKSQIIFSYLFKHTDFYYNNIKEKEDNNIDNNINNSNNSGELDYLGNGDIDNDDKQLSQYNIESLQLLESLIHSIIKSNEQQQQQQQQQQESTIKSLFTILYKCFISSILSTKSFTNNIIQLLANHSNIIKDETYRFRITFVVIDLLVNELDATQERTIYIELLELFNSVVFEQWKSLELFNGQFFYDNLKSLQSIISNQKFERRILYSFINSYKPTIDCNSSSSSSYNNIVEDNTNISVHKDQQKQQQQQLDDVISAAHGGYETTSCWTPPGINFIKHCDFQSKIDMLSTFKPSLLLLLKLNSSNSNSYDGQCKILESHINFLFDCIIQENESNLVSTFIWIPYHISYLLPNQQNIFNHLLTILVTSSATIDYESIWVIYFYFYYLHSKMNFNIEIIDRIGSLCLNATFNRKLSSQTFKSFISTLFRIVDDFELEQPFKHLQHLYTNNYTLSLNISITKCLNQLSNDEDHQQNDDTLNELQILSIVDNSSVINSIVKNSIKNKGQQQFLVRLIVRHFPYFKAKTLFGELFKQQFITTDQTRANCIQFIYCLLSEVKLPSIVNHYQDALFQEIIFPLLSFDNNNNNNTIDPSKITFTLDLLELLLSKYKLKDKDIISKLIVSKSNELELSINVDKDINIDWILQQRIDYYKSKTTTTTITYKTKINLKLLQQSHNNLPTTKHFTKEMIIIHNIIDLSSISEYHTNEMIKAINNDEYLQSLFRQSKLKLFTMIASIQLPYSAVGYYDVLVDHFIPRLIDSNLCETTVLSFLYQCLCSNIVIFSNNIREQPPQHYQQHQQYTMQFIKSILNQIKKVIFQHENTFNYLFGLLYLVKTIKLLVYTSTDTFIDLQIFYILTLGIIDKLNNDNGEDDNNNNDELKESQKKKRSTILNSCQNILIDISKDNETATLISIIDKLKHLYFLILLIVVVAIIKEFNNKKFANPNHIN